MMIFTFFIMNILTVCLLLIARDYNGRPPWHSPRVLTGLPVAVRWAPELEAMVRRKAGQKKEDRMGLAK
jgi:hypothetical protein